MSVAPPLPGDDRPETPEKVKEHSVTWVHVGHMANIVAFYLCNPVKVFSAIVTKANSTPTVEVQLFVDPSADRATLTPDAMPTTLLSGDEFGVLAQTAPVELLEQHLAVGYSFEMFRDLAMHPKPNKKALTAVMPRLDEALRRYLPLRDTDKPVQILSKWNRGR